MNSESPWPPPLNCRWNQAYSACLAMMDKEVANNRKARAIAKKLQKKHNITTAIRKRDKLFPQSNVADFLRKWTQFQISQLTKHPWKKQIQDKKLIETEFRNEMIFLLKFVKEYLCCFTTPQVIDQNMREKFKLDFKRVKASISERICRLQQLNERNGFQDQVAINYVAALELTFSKSKWFQENGESTKNLFVASQELPFADLRLDCEEALGFYRKGSRMKALQRNRFHSHKHRKSQLSWREALQQGKQYSKVG